MVSRPHTLNVSDQTTEARLAAQIEQAIFEAARHGEVIDQAAARQIAAAIHRGVDGELAHFAGTGELRNYQLTRLELHYAVKDEPRRARWANALRAYVTDQQRRHQAGQTPADTATQGSAGAVGADQGSAR